MKSSKKLLVALVAGLLVLSVFTGCSKKDSKARTLNVAIQPSTGFIPAYVLREKGWLEEALTPMGVKVQWQVFEAGPPINESMAAGLSDIGTNGDVPTVSSIAAGQKNVIIGMPGSGPDAYAMLARADDDTFNSYNDMKGKKIATVVGSTGHNLTKKLLTKAGLTFDDIEFINIAAGDASIALSTKQVDAVLIWEPNVTRLVDNGVAKIVAKGSETTLRGTNTLLAREKFVKENPDITKVFLEQYARAVAELPKLDDATTAKVAEGFRLEPAQLKKLMSKYSNPVEITKIDTDALQDTIQFLVSIEKLGQEYPITDHCDNSYFEGSKAKQYLK